MTTYIGHGKPRAQVDTIATLARTPPGHRRAVARDTQISQAQRRPGTPSIAPYRRRCAGLAGAEYYWAAPATNAATI
jgi:hypothetical protein